MIERHVMELEKKQKKKFSVDQMASYPGQIPIWAPGKEPLPPGFTEEDRAAYLQQKKYQEYFTMGMESCIVKSVMAGGAGFAMGAFFSLMSSSFAYEDPYLRQQTQAGLRPAQKAREVFKEMGRGMWSSGRGFAKIGALFAGIECCIEGVRFSFFRPIIGSLILFCSTGPKMTFTIRWGPGFSPEAFWRVIRGLGQPWLAV